MVVHSFINSIEPPGSADMSQIPINRCGKFGDPKLRYLLKIELKDYGIRLRNALVSNKIDNDIVLYPLL